MKRLICVLVLLFPITSCSTMKVEKLSASPNVSKICIKENEDVKVGGFLEIIRTGFDRHGISSKVFTKNQPATCSTILTYTALRRWDFAPYMSHAELWLRDKNGKQIGYAQYHIIGGGGFDFSKWRSTASKMRPVIDKLLADYGK